ncbi:hypothetical protein OROMI_002369 [Orobanche minor]
MPSKKLVKSATTPTSISRCPVTSSPLGNAILIVENTQSPVGRRLERWAVPLKAFQTAFWVAVFVGFGRLRFEKGD